MLNEQQDSFHSDSFSGEDRSSLPLIEVLPCKPKIKIKHTWDNEGKKLINSPQILSVLSSPSTRTLFKSLLLQGVPSKYRYKYWLNVSGATREKINNKNYYRNLLINYPDFIPSKYEKIIQADLTRTFPEDPYFHNADNISKLKNILIAYSRRNNSIGYYQGFNFIAGRLLQLFNNEEDSFWIFTQVIECVLPVEHYSELAGMMVDCAGMLKMLKILQKEMMLHLNELNAEIFVNNLLSQWMLSLFVHRMNMETFLMIWDAMFFEGYIVLIRAAIGIMCLMQDRLMQLHTIDEVVSFFDKEISNFNQNDILYEFILDSNCTISNDVVKHFRKLLFPAYAETIMKSKQSVPNVTDVECDSDWPFCVENFSNTKICNCVTLRAASPLAIIDDFYTGDVGKKVLEGKRERRKEKEGKGKERKMVVDVSELERMKKQYWAYEEMLVEREVHKCGCGKVGYKEIEEQMEKKNNLFYKYYYENKESGTKKKNVASSYFDFHDLKKNTTRFAEIINNIEQRLENQQAVITLKRSRSRYQKRKEVQKEKDLEKEKDIE